MIRSFTFFMLLLVVSPIILSAQDFNSNQHLRDIHILAQDSMDGRRTGEPGSELARKYILKRFNEIGIQQFDSSYLKPFSFKARMGKSYDGLNIIGFIPGKTKKYIVITAHYDHEGVKEGFIYNGADDNASGVAGLLAIAEYLSDKELQHSFIFCALDGEELGLQGAREFVRNPPVDRKDIVFNLNMDMISHNDKNEIYASGTYHNKFLIPVLEEVNGETKVSVLLGHDKPSEGYNDWTFSSDHGPFHRKGIPFIYFGVEDHKDYHKPTDTYENINPGFFLDVLDMLQLFIGKLDSLLTERSE